MGSEMSLPGIPPHSDCRIVVVGPKSGDDSLAELANLPREARILATGTSLEEIMKDGDSYAEANVLLNISGNSKTLGPIINSMPFLRWIHSSHAGVEHIICPEMSLEGDLVVTNAKGVFSSTLAEYVMSACLYFAKDIARLNRQKGAHRWEKFDMVELSGQVMGIVGYGDIGRSCAKLAKAFNMKVLALRRNPSLSTGDPLVDELFGNEGLIEIMQRSDYLVTALPLTPGTKRIFSSEVFSSAKSGQVFINVGRGGLVDDAALIEALSNGTLRGAASDVFSEEPLPADSPYWDLPNLIISPHNADQTVDFRHRAVRAFTENCKLFLKGEDFDSVVDLSRGY